MEIKSSLPHSQKLATSVSLSLSWARSIQSVHPPQFG